MNTEPHRCHVCMSAFSSAYDLKRHTMLAHREDDDMNRWTPEDIQNLRDNAHLGVDAVAKILGRSVGAVTQKAFTLDVSLKKQETTPKVTPVIAPTVSVEPSVDAALETVSRSSYTLPADAPLTPGFVEHLDVPDEVDVPEGDGGWRNEGTVLTYRLVGADPFDGDDDLRSELIATLAELGTWQATLDDPAPIQASLKRIKELVAR